MADTTTTNISLTKPEVGASTDSWGTKINTDLDTIDAIFKADGTGTSVGLNVGSGKVLNVTGTANFATIAASGNVTLGNASTDTLNVGNGGLVKDASGNVGIGTTPAAWGSGRKALQLGTYGAFATNSNSFYLNNNAYTDGTNWVYLNTNYATRYESTNGVHSWSVAASGTAGTTATFNESMRIDTSGNVGIGNTYSIGGNYLSLAIGGSKRGIIAVRNNAATDMGYAYVNESSGFFTVEAAGANPLVLSTNGAERARIDSSGNFRVRNLTGGSNNNGLLVEEDGANTTRVSIGGANSSSATGLSIYSTGAGAFRFFVSYSGQISATSTSISAISDESLKENIVDLETGIAEVMALRPRRFDWKEETQLEAKNVAGFIAQEVEQVLPELVYDYQYNETEIKKSIKMGDILPTLVKAIQEQQAMITSQSEQLSSQAAVITSLTARIEALEQA